MAASLVMDYALYIASAVGAVALFMMMPRGRGTMVRIGALLGAATLGALWLVLHRQLPTDVAQMGIGIAGWAYYYIFSALAVGAAARVITHTKPVYAALWFVMVVLASSGLFLVLQAEFMAFAMVIIYGGAILVTYVFVIMLASQSAELTDDNETEATHDESHDESHDKSGHESVASPEYDRVAREPAAAVVVGFLLLAMFLDVTFRQAPSPNPAARGVSNEVLVRGDENQPAVLTDRPDRRLIEDLDEEDRAALEEVGVSEEAVTNVERVGVDLFRGHPLGLELAGVILLVALVGAVVIARQRGRL